MSELVTCRALSKVDEGEQLYVQQTQASGKDYKPSPASLAQAFIYEKALLGSSLRVNVLQQVAKYG